MTAKTTKTGKMDPEIKARWLQALRSGEYEQGNGRLKTQASPEEEFKYCCLGVLCDLYVKDHPEVEWVPVGPMTGTFEIDSQSTYLPSTVREWAHINSEQSTGIEVMVLVDDLEDDYELVSPGHTSLIDLNDDGAPFDVIANIIEREL